MTLNNQFSILTAATAALLASCASTQTPAVQPLAPASTQTSVTAVQDETAKPRSAMGKTADAGKAVGEGALDAGKGLLSLPGKTLGVFSSDELPNLAKGVQELGLSGNLNFAGKTAYNADISYGYFFADGWEVGLTANAFGREDFNLGAGLFTEYNFVFDESKWVPYLGTAVKWARVSTSNTSQSSAAFTGELGLKYFIRSNVSVFSAINFDWAPNDVFGLGDDVKDNAQNLNFGLRFYL